MNVTVSVIKPCFINTNVHEHRNLDEKLLSEGKLHIYLTDLKHVHAITAY